MLTPRPYQQEAVDAIFNFLRTKPGNPVLDACVSSGKSLIIAEVVKRAFQLKPDCRVLMLTHVKELIEQNFNKLKSQYPMCDAGIYSASVGQKKAYNSITYAGIQSVYKKPNRIGHRDLILVDEAHLISPEQTTMYRRFIDAMKAINPRVRVIGFTGTAYRTKEGLITEGEGALFDDVCHSITMSQMLEWGYIMPLVSKQSEVQADLSNVKTTAGDFNVKGMQEEMDKEELTRKAIDEVERWASDRRCGLFFCCGVDHAMHVRDSLRDRGYTAEMISGKTKKKEREEILERFKRGEIRYLTNDSVLTTGTDIPMLDLIVLLRGTKSPVLYTQILGRGVRCFGKDAEESIRNGKKNCMVLDFAGNVERFGPVDKITFKPKVKRGEKGIVVTPVKVCEKCREPSPIYAKVCDFCGKEFPPVTREMINHAEKAYSGAIMSVDIKPIREEITNCFFSRHKKAGKPDSLKVSYFRGIGNQIASEWVCLEHEGYARAKAEKWWRARFGCDAPATVTDALQRTPAIPKAIWTRKNGKYMEVVSCEF